jgi:hypothetical protein
MKITGFADAYTEAKLGAALEHTLVMVKPDATQHLGDILAALARCSSSLFSHRHNPPPHAHNKKKPWPRLAAWTCGLWRCA